MKRTTKEFEINGKRYAYIQIKMGGEERFFVMILKDNRWEDYCIANGYGFKSIEAAGRAFDNRLLFVEHYEVNDDEPRIVVSPDYLSSLQKFRKFKK